VEAKAIGVEAEAIGVEAVDERAASTSLVALTIFIYFFKSFQTFVVRFVVLVQVLGLGFRFKGLGSIRFYHVQCTSAVYCTLAVD